MDLAIRQKLASQGLRIMQLFLKWRRFSNRTIFSPDLNLAFEKIIKDVLNSVTRKQIYLQNLYACDIISHTNLCREHS